MVKTSSCCMDFLKKARQSKVIAVVIVSTTLLIDYMLLLAIVPVVPPFLWKIHLKEHPEISQNHVNQVHDISTSTSYTPAFSNSTFMVEATVQPPMKELESAYLATQSVKIAAVIAAKPAVQIIANIFVGPLIDRIGYHIPLFVGLVVICFTAITFGLGQTYAVLLISVAIQGIGSSCAMAGGMTMLASVYIDPQKRGQVIGICLSVIGVGLVAGPPYGSVMNAFVGKPATFLLLAGITILTGICQVCYSSLKIEKIHANNEAPSMWILLKDPYILLAASSISLVNIVFGVLNSGLPAWLIKTFKSPKWLIGLAYLPLCIAYAVTTNVMSFIPAKTYRWAFALGGVVSSSVGCLCLPFATSFAGTVGPVLLVGIGNGFLEANMFPILADLVDSRHKSTYGSVYAIADIAICFGFAIGPLLLGGLIQVLNFPWILRIVFILLLLYAPLLVLLKNAIKHPQSERQPLIDELD